MKRCQRCGAPPEGWKLHDYCANCSRDLCPECMQKGCCGKIPAESGKESDFGPADKSDTRAPNLR